MQNTTFTRSPRLRIFLCPIHTHNSKLNVEFLAAQSPSRSEQPLLLFLHGVTRCWQTFIPLMNGLYPRYEAIGLDFPGHGKSGRLNDYYVQDHTQAVANWLQHDSQALIGDRSLIVYGHSLGGMVAARWPLNFRNKLRQSFWKTHHFVRWGNW
ncbi:MAG: alpha/beta fold hydrolase [Planctomycetaceae bacterium]